MAEVFLTVHAQRAMAARNVTHEEVEAVVNRPEVSYRGSESKEGYRIYQRGSLGVVAKPIREGVLVLTVLWRVGDQWTNDEMKDERK